MNKIIKKILLFLLIIGCNKKDEPNEPIISSSAKSLSSFIYSAKVEVVKVNNKDYFIQNEDGPIKLKFSNNIKDKTKDLCVKFSIKQGSGNLYYTLKGSSISRKKLITGKDEVFEQNTLWEYEPTCDGAHKLVFDFTNKGARFQADVDFIVKKSAIGMSFLMTSIKNGDIKKAEELIESGASVNIQDKDGHTPLYYCIKYSDSKDLFNKLKDKKADLDVKNNIGQTLLMESIKEGLSKKIL